MNNLKYNIDNSIFCCEKYDENGIAIKNRIFPYYYYLKVAATLSLSEEEYLCFFRLCNKSGSYDDVEEAFINGVYNKLRIVLYFLDKDSFLFFDSLFNIFSSDTMRRVLFITDDKDDTETIIKYNASCYKKDLSNKR